MIKINGTTIPSPSSYQVGIMDVSKSERNSNAQIIIERIATKRKLELGWSYLSQTDLTTILNLVSAVFFTVEYPDIATGTLQTKTFYVGDRTAQVIDYRDGVMRWKDIKFNFIEK